METSFYSPDELRALGLADVGENVMISRKCSIYSPGKIHIGSNVRIDDFCILSGHVSIGSYVHIGAYSALYGSHGIIMDDFSGLSGRVIIYSSSDDYSGEGMSNPTVPEKYRRPQSSLIRLERLSLVGAGSVLLPGAGMKEGAVLGAMSLLKMVVPAWDIYAGIPAKKIKKRQSNIILTLEQNLNDQISNHLNGVIPAGPGSDKP